MTIGQYLINEKNLWESVNKVLQDLFKKVCKWVGSKCKPLFMQFAFFPFRSFDPWLLSFTFSGDASINVKPEVGCVCVRGGGGGGTRACVGHLTFRKNF